MLRHKPTHKGFKRKTFTEVIEAKNKFANAKSDHQKDKDRWNAEWKRDNADIKYCWSCGKSGGASPDDVITQMHGLKQRFIRTRDDCRFAAWVCWGEHRRYDEAQGLEVHRMMAEFVDSLIVKITIQERNRND
jgi:hypothetical protein